MATKALTPLANITLSSAQASVTFSSISGAYRDLKIVISGKHSSANENILIRLNSDTGSNYSYVYMLGSGSGSGASGASTTTGLIVGSLATGQSDAIIELMDYSATDKHKTALARSNDAANQTSAWATRWANTAAVTSVQVLVSGTFAAGSTFALYGVSA